VHDHELRFAQSLWPLVTTPRAAKRLINTYRLVRAVLSEAELAALVAGDHEVVLLLLAVLIGSPRQVVGFFHDLLSGEQDRDFWALVAAEADRPEGRWAGSARGLLAVRPRNRPELPLERIRRWVPRVARYSFQTLRLATSE
jgi:hypothetical protein